MAEIFNTATWNFLAGDREVEDILKDKKLSRITIRGGTGTVLPTIAGIRDIANLGWKDSVGASLHVPSNTLSSHNPSLNETIEEHKFYETLLEQSLGVQVWKNYQYFPDQLIIILNMTEENKIPGNITSTVFRVVKEAKDAKIIFTCKKKQKLLPEFRSYAIKAWSAIYWEGLNAFFSQQVEEAVREANPKKILILGVSEENVFYSAIGAVDYFIIEDSQFRDPASLELWNILDIGKKVSVMAFPKNGAANMSSVEGLVLRHLRDTLHVDSVIPDYAYSKVANHKIMIDIE